ncbi:hypothetical protein ANCCEY_10617 [Ancylostoma ceylanicum]|uniref:Uncharacterized protein n=1 Tax=Ancylostoma ceylanicum TaxID=53326 RepID=A0A0D6LE02_9BILA|nr:hypothetical protein ANCCEY_10617 [Ancylostoma ceylanicum]
MVQESSPEMARSESQPIIIQQTPAYQPARPRLFVQAPPPVASVPAVVPAPAVVAVPQLMAGPPQFVAGPPPVAAPPVPIAGPPPLPVQVPPPPPPPPMPQQYNAMPPPPPPPPPPCTMLLQHLPLLTTKCKLISQKHISATLPTRRNYDCREKQL